MENTAVTPLLTEHGIPAQPLSAEPEALTALLSCPDIANKSQMFEYSLSEGKLLTPHKANDHVVPFVAKTAQLAGAYTAWGFRPVSDRQLLTVVAKRLKIADATYPRSATLHQDYLYQYGLLHLRILYASSIPADFITDPAFAKLSRKDRIAGPLYKADVLEKAGQQDLVWRPVANEGVLFDGNTLHRAQLAQQAHRRMLVDITVSLRPPRNWRKRVREGDVPVLD